MLKQRILSAMLLVPFLLITMYLGGLCWLAVVACVIILAIKEYTAMVQGKDIYQPFWLMIIITFLFVVIAYYDANMLGVAIAFALGSATCWVLFNKAPFPSFTMAVCGMLYVSWSFSHLIAIRQLPDGFLLILLTFLIAWSTDTGAYAVGMLFGKHKIMPAISPKKSWEGAIGGTVTCMAAIAVYNYFVLNYPMCAILLIGFLCSVLGQIGDFLESWLKRWAGVKDASNFIPGHGGILDRFDSIILIAPFIYYAYEIILCIGRGGI